MPDDQMDPAQNQPRDYQEIAAQYAQALRLTFDNVEVTDNVGELLETLEAGDDHTDVPHWDQGTGHFDGLHPDLHGDLPHWDTPITLPEAPESNGEEPWRAFFSEQRQILEWTKTLAARFEERLNAVEEIVARQLRAAEYRQGEEG